MSETGRTFCVPGKQIPQARPRVTVNGTYNPRNPWRESIQWLASEAFRGFPLEGRRSVCIRLVGCSHRGDVDNYSKVCLDAMQGHAYRNDNQIDDLRVFREASKGGAYTSIAVSVLT